MKRFGLTSIRSRLVLAFLGIVLLTVIPAALIVANLVRQSFRIGVNPTMEAALADGVAFSREVYDRRKRELSDRLAELLRNSDPDALTLPADAAPWRFRGLHVFDAAGERLRLETRNGAVADAVNAGHLAALAEAPGGRLVLAERERNRFLALQRVDTPGGPRVVVLVAAMGDAFLAESDRFLELYQRYRLLALSSWSIPSGFLYAFMAMSLVIVAGVIVLATWLAGRLTRPVTELARGTEELGRGNLDFRIDLRRRDEIGALVAQFNRMAGDLQAFQKRAVALERMATWQEIARRLAHEIKNPLTPIQLTLQELVDRYEGPDADFGAFLTECHGIIHEEVENLRRLVREFSEFGRLPEPRFVAGDLNVLVEETAGLYPQRNIELRLDAALPEFPFDGDQIRRVLINLLDNAVQADPSGAAITVTTGVANGLAEVTVADRGAGIPAEQLETIFQPYVTMREGGTGLGLAISRKMAEEHGGALTAESAPGEGSRFILTVRMDLAAFAG